MAGEQSRPPPLAMCEQVQGERHGDDESRMSFSSTYPVPGGFLQQKPENVVQ